MIRAKIAKWCLYIFGVSNFFIYMVGLLIFGGILGFASAIDPDLSENINMVPTVSFLLGFLVCLVGSIFHFVVGAKLMRYRRWAFNSAIVLFTVNLFNPLFFLSLIGYYCLFHEETAGKIDAP